MPQRYFVQNKDPSPCYITSQTLSFLGTTLPLFCVIEVGTRECKGTSCQLRRTVNYLNKSQNLLFGRLLIAWNLIWLHSSSTPLNYSRMQTQKISPETQYATVLFSDSEAQISTSAYYGRYLPTYTISYSYKVNLEVTKKDKK